MSLRDTMKPLRSAVYSVLNGNTDGIPVYDEKRKVAETDQTYILLTTQQETGIEQNDCTFITQSSIDVEVIAGSEFEVSKNVIDDVSNDVTALVMNGLTAPSGFQFLNLKRESAFTQNLSVTETQSILRKIIRFTVQIIQQN